MNLFSSGFSRITWRRATWHYHNNYRNKLHHRGDGQEDCCRFDRGISAGRPGIYRDLTYRMFGLQKRSIRGSCRSRTLEMVFLQFSANIFFPQMLVLPEFKNVKRALELSERGIQIVGQTLNEVSEIMLQLPYLKGFRPHE